MATRLPGGYSAVRMGRGGFLSIAAAVLALSLAGVARADDWWPHPADATWTYAWTDSVYNGTPTKEKVTVKEQKNKSFVFSWTTKDLGNSGDAPLSFGDMAFQETTAGLINTDWSSNPPPPDFPILCPQIGVSSSSTYQGTETVKVPGFPDGVLAAKVRTDTTQAGALGDPYGSGVRTVWWVYGVGPVKMVFEHAGGSDAPVTTSELQETNLTPKTPPSDENYFPMTKGLKLRYSWTNTRYIKKPSVQEITVDEVVNSSARFTVKHIKGPIRVAGSYGFSTRTDGVTNIWGLTKAATAIKFPALGPKSLPRDKRRHFFTPFDLMNFGFNPLLTAYPAAGQTWGSKNPSRDFSTFGVNGSAKVLGIQKVKVPAGTFDALVVRASLSQPGYKFGSGTRTSWFAPGKGLVKLVFRHGDGSVSTVVLLK